MSTYSAVNIILLNVLNYVAVLTHSSRSMWGQHQEAVWQPAVLSANYEKRQFRVCMLNIMDNKIANIGNKCVMLESRVQGLEEMGIFT